MRVDVLLATDTWRAEFNFACLDALARWTPGSLLGEIVAYNDSPLRVNTKDEKGECNLKDPMGTGPCVETLTDFLEKRKKAGVSPDAYFVAIEDGVIVCPGWLDTIAHTLEKAKRRGEVIDVLGVGVADGNCVKAPCARKVEKAGCVGAVAVYRYGALFDADLEKYGKFGLVKWQRETTGLNKAKLTPGLPIFLLDRLPIEPWVSYRKKYEEKGTQRRKEACYSKEESGRWEWWVRKGKVAA